MRQSDFDICNNIPNNANGDGGNINGGEGGKSSGGGKYLQQAFPRTE